MKTQDLDPNRPLTPAEEADIHSIIEKKLQEPTIVDVVISYHRFETSKQLDAILKPEALTAYRQKGFNAAVRELLTNPGKLEVGTKPAFVVPVGGKVRSFGSVDGPF